MRLSLPNTTPKANPPLLHGLPLWSVQEQEASFDYPSASSSWPLNIGEPQGPQTSCFRATVTAVFSSSLMALTTIYTWVILTWCISSPHLSFRLRAYILNYSLGALNAIWPHHQNWKHLCFKGHHGKRKDSLQNGEQICKSYVLFGLPRWHSGKEPTSQCRRYRRHGFNPWVRKIPWNRKWQPTPVFLPGKSHGQGSLAGYSPEQQTVGHDWAHTHKIPDLNYSHLLKIIILNSKDKWPNFNMCKGSE